MEARFHWADYVVFGGSLLLSMSIGVWFACTGKKVSTTDEFLMAGRNMPVFPVSMSMFVSWLSAISFLGDPVEVYTYGSIYVFLGVGYILSLPVIAHFFAPRLHELGLVSIYEFLEQKYNKPIRLLGACLCIAITESWLAVVLYAPSLAFSQVSGVPVWVSNLSIGLICTFYTTIGGMKAVLWADTLQMIIMVAGQLAVVIQGTIQVGGIGKVWQICADGGRMNFNSFNPSPFLRATFWTGLFGGFFRVLNPYIGTQFLVQRYSTVSTKQKAKLVVIWNIPMFLLLVSLFWLIGLVMYAVYHDCDPVSDNKIELADQMVPLLVMQLLNFMPGIPGLFIACVFSASLSSLSSGFNGSAAVVLKDFICPLYQHVKKHEMTDNLQTKISKGLAVFFGLATTGLSFLIMVLGSSIFALTSKITGMFGGPLSSVFVCGLMFPKLSNAGVMSGFIFSLVLSLWTGIGALFVEPRWTQLPVSTEGCTRGNLSTAMPYQTTIGDNLTSNTNHNDDISFQMSDIYGMSPLLYGPLTTIIGVVSATMFHFLYAFANKTCCRRRYKALSQLKRESSMINYYQDTESDPTASNQQRETRRNISKQPGARQSEIRGMIHESNM